MVNEEVKEKLEDKEITGVRISTESEELEFTKSLITKYLKEKSYSNSI